MIAWQAMLAALYQRTGSEFSPRKKVLPLQSGVFHGLQLSISPKTVKNHTNNILSKLHLYDRTQATLCAIRSGLVKV